MVARRKGYIGLLGLGVLCMVAFVLTAPGNAAAGDRAGVENIRFGVENGTTRIVIDSDGPLTYRHFTLASGSHRLVLDLSRVNWAMGGKAKQSGKGWGRGLVKGYLYAHGDSSTSRLVFNLAGPAGIRRHFTLKPNHSSRRHRLVFDLHKVSHKEFAQASSAYEPNAQISAKRQDKSVVVIDPGHGGRDSGALSARGSKEKDINLAVARTLAEALKAKGRYVVHLTRERDEYLELEERVRRARDFHADLFISLHADSGPDKSLRGASVYTLSAKGERRAAVLRKGQDWILPVETDNTRPNEVKGLLVELIKRETKSQSALFAQKLIQSLKTTGWPSLRRTHRNAGFFVLLAPDVPAVLLEMGFLTNASDESRLASKRRHTPLVSAITQSIDAFFAERDSLYLAGN